MFFIVLRFIEIRLILQKRGIKKDAEENHGLKGVTYNSDLSEGRGPSLCLPPPVDSHHSARLSASRASVCLSHLGSFGASSSRGPVSREWYCEFKARNGFPERLTRPLAAPGLVSLWDVVFGFLLEEEPVSRSCVACCKGKILKRQQKCCLWC